MALVWFITGVSSGFGLEIALKALERGHKVIGTVRDRQKATETVESLENKGGHVLELDITYEEACFQVWHAAEKIHGHVDILCNNVGMSYMGALEDYTDNEVHAQMDVNVYGPYRLIRAALPGFRERRSGTIVNMSSVSGVDGSIASGLYAASKFALEGLSEGLSRELAEYNIKVLIVEPGAFRTNFLGAFKANNKNHLEQYPTAKQAMDIFERFNGKQPGDPAKAANIIVDVASGQGIAGHLKDRALRLPLGPDCIARFDAKLKSMSAELEMVRAVGMTTNIQE